MLEQIRGEFRIHETRIFLTEEQLEGLELAVEGKSETGSFYYRLPGEEWTALAVDLDITFLSGGFTGNYIAIACHDMNHFMGTHADFDYFTYKGKD